MMITSPDDAALDELCDRLAGLSPALEEPGAWPAEQLRRCAAAGVFRWFLGPDWKGLGWSEADLLRGYMRLAAACLTTTFVITQRMGAVNRIAACENAPLKQSLLPALVAGESFATVGISHLTTSRQHLAKPVLQATETSGGWTLDGYSPWVTGGQHAQHIVLGATQLDGRQILFALPTELPGVHCDEPPQLTALSASRTGSVRLSGVPVDRRWLMAGPAFDVMKLGAGAKTGGLATSALAIGLSAAAIADLKSHSRERAALADPTDALEAELATLQADLLAVAAGESVCTSEDLRSRANSLALRSTQAGLAAAKGAGFVAGHAAGRRCREALFFLVWSCPQNVVAANLCELAGLAE
jgi:alkylation response protein AidB-like acyl-CoA dehydrogenase